ncbi:MAG TPA: diguanylate cyclase [Terriglobales bacterium]
METTAVLQRGMEILLSKVAPLSKLEQLLQALCASYGVPHAAVLVRAGDGRELAARCTVGWPAALAAVRVPMGYGVVGQAAELQAPVYVPEVIQHPTYIAAIPGVRCELAIPLLAEGELLGVLDLATECPDSFSVASRQVLPLVAAQLALILLQEKTLQAVQAATLQLDTLSAIARQTAMLNEPDELLERFCALVLQAFSVDHVALLLQQEDRLVLRAHCGRLAPLLQRGCTLPADTGLYGRALLTQEPVLASNVHQEPEYSPWLSSVGSELYLPLVSVGRAFGLLLVSCSRLNAFSSELRALASVADVCAAVIENATHFQQVHQLAFRDGLTGVFNRRFFERRLPEEVERALRYRASLALLMIDLDGFKQLNDNAGHMTGDEVLRQVSAALLRHLRKVDILCRFGGDEFAVLLPRASAESAYHVAEKLRRSVADLRVEGVTRSIGLSIGVAACPQHASTRDQLIQAADEALYRAKQGGRNRAVLSDQAPERAASPSPTGRGQCVEL